MAKLDYRKYRIGLELGITPSELATDIPDDYSLRTNYTTYASWDGWYSWKGKSSNYSVTLYGSIDQYNVMNSDVTSAYFTTTRLGSASITDTNFKYGLLSIDPRSSWLNILSGDDEIYGTNFYSDKIQANTGDDKVYGYYGDDILWGGYGNDWLNGGGENDVLYGEAGNDYLTGGSGNDLLDGGDGFDIVMESHDDYTFKIEGNKNLLVDNKTGDINTLISIEEIKLLGSDRNFATYSVDSLVKQYNAAKIIPVHHNLTGTVGGDDLKGESGDTFGNDTLSGGLGADTLTGFRGADDLRGEAGDDVLRAGNGKDLLNGGAGADSLYGGFGVNTFADENDGSADKLYLKSDQLAYNWVYEKAANSPNGEKADNIGKLDTTDQVYIQGATTAQLTFASVTHTTPFGDSWSGVGIYAAGTLEAVFTGGNLAQAQLQAITFGTPA